MRNVILGAVGGLILGTVGALAISSYLNDEKVSALQSQLDAANASLEKAAQDKKQLSNETSGVSSQVDQLVSSNEELKKELDEAKKSPAASATAEPVNPATLAGMIMGHDAGRTGRLSNAAAPFSAPDPPSSDAGAGHCDQDGDGGGTPSSVASSCGKCLGGDAVVRAREEQTEAGTVMEEVTGRIPRPPAPSIRSIKTLASVLTPQQQAAYQQVQADEKVARGTRLRRSR